MLKKIKNAIKPFLVHPAATALIVITGLCNSLASIGILADQLHMNLGLLTHYIHGSDQLALKCMVVSAICTALAGMGRSFISFVDNLEKDVQPQ